MNAIQRFTTRLLLLVGVVFAAVGCTPAHGIAPDRAPALAGASSTFPNASFALYFGDGSDGDSTCSAPTTLTRDVFYRNLTLSSGCVITTDGYHVLVSGILDATQAPSGAIRPHALMPGGNAVSTGAGASPGNSNTRTWQGQSFGVAGKAGGTTTGTAGATNSGTAAFSGGPSGAGGAGGTGSSGAGGAGGSVTNASTSIVLRLPIQSIHWSTATGPVQGGLSSPSGGSGGGDGTAGGGSGAGAPGGGMVYIAARFFSRSSTNTNTGIIVAPGNAGGNGDVPVSGNRGGGGGAGGSGGGHVYILVGAFLGSTQPNAIDVSGGAGGNGAAGTGTGTSGAGAQAGFGGRVTTINMNFPRQDDIDTSTRLPTVTMTDRTAVGGAAASGATGGASTPAMVDL